MIREKISKKFKVQDEEGELQYQKIDLIQASLLPNTLILLLSATSAAYMEKVVAIRSSHLDLLKKNLILDTGDDEQSLWLWICQDFIHQNVTKDKTREFEKFFQKDSRYLRLKKRFFEINSVSTSPGLWNSNVSSSMGMEVNEKREEKKRSDQKQPAVGFLTRRSSFIEEKAPTGLLPREDLQSNLSSPHLNFRMLPNQTMPFYKVIFPAIVLVYFIHLH